MTYAEVPLLKELAGTSGSAGGRGKFHASVITTFNAYLPFYEDVILRRLVRLGSHHNVLLMDARQWHEEMAQPLSRPKLAGSDYTLLPIRAPAAFHPKIGLLAGPDRARIFIGSHNVTFSGFGLNREITTTLDIPGAGDSSAGVARAVWSFIREWIESQENLVPDDVIDAARLMGRTFAPWLEEPATQEGDVRFIGSLPHGDSLWDQLPIPPDASVQRVTAVGAFFDRGFGFLRGVQELLDPVEFVIGIEPATVEIDPAAEIPGTVHFVDATELARGEGYLHSKVLFIEFSDDRALLVTGSPNLSGAAWTKGPSGRNAEAAIVQIGDMARDGAQDLGLFGLHDQTPVTAETWTLVGARLRDDSDSEDDVTGLPTGMALVEDERLLIYVDELPDPGPDRVLGFGAGQDKPLLDTDSVRITEFGASVEVEPENLPALSVVQLLQDDAVIGRALVHDPRAIRRHARSDDQSAFHMALEDLGDADSPDIASVIRLAEKLIFEEGSKGSGQPSTHAGHEGSDQGESGSKRKIGSLIIESKDGVGAASKRRRIRSDDLGFVIDLLIQRLGNGLYKTGGGRAGGSASEEEDIGADEEDGPAFRKLPIPPDMVQECQKKVRLLVGRTIKRLTKAHEGASSAPSPSQALGALHAVLALLPVLRAQDRHHESLEGSESLVPLTERRRLLEESLALLFERSRDLYKLAVAEWGDDPHGELSSLRGRLLWLAWDSRLDMRLNPGGRTEAEDDHQQQWLLNRARMVSLVPIVAADARAVKAAEESIRAVVGSGGPMAHRAMEWIDLHIQWGRRIVEKHRNLEEWDCADGDREMAEGMMAVALKEDATRIRLIQGVTDTKAYLVDIGESKSDRSQDVVTFLRKTVVVAPLPEIS